ncbi:uncharacterized protein AB675_6883 [Cyphellophora attinorum]|uniref:DUF7896 domain-containing protein n=1 Tax=Cyphellophora attinorum TaxID=1664694 RepID=A0A0N1HER4_9EURO|nr:uncharacterized protein AB675_6883 [Phialophora attinorum]KPI43417.1 hypothetical protein AB675_6883 [Phialophora attinorum]
METGHAKGLIQAIQAFRNVYDHEHQHLSPSERETGWQQYWTSISAQAISGSGAPVVPSKRSASHSFGEEPSSKRPGLDNLVTDTPTHPLQRQISAPAFLRSTTRDISTTVPIRRPAASLATQSETLYSFTRTGLGNIEEVQDLSPAEYLEQSQNVYATPHSLTPSPAVERGEFNDQTTSNLTYHQAYEPSAPQPPMTVISDSSLVSRSAVLSEPMTRSNTDDVLCKGFDMFRMNSLSKPNESIELGKAEDLDDQTLPFSTMVPQQYHDISYSGNPLPFPYCSEEMAASLSQESDVSSSPFTSVHSSPRMQESPTASVRLLAPKQESDKSSSPTGNPRFVDVKGADGTVKRKAEITRAARREPDQKDVDGKFLANCKACRNKKTYGANYNAAAHLRRAHFNPPKNKRGGRGKKSEGRGGMGGGNKPAMDELKHWMYEVWEENTSTSKVLAHELAVDLDSFEAYQQQHSYPGEYDELTYSHDVLLAMHHQHQQQQQQQHEQFMYGIPATTMAGHHPSTADLDDSTKKQTTEP